MQNAPQANPQATQANIAQQNMIARQTVISNAFPMLQQIFSSVYQPATQAQFTLPPQNVGLISGFLIKLSATITNPASGSSALSLTNFGPANLLQNVLFTDLQNYQRINTSGWHLAMLNSVRQGRPFLSSTPSDSPFGFGSNWNVIKAPATIATNSSGTIYMYYWVPLAYSDTDLTGSIYANVVNATMNLQLTLATAAQAVVANTADPTLAIYQGAGAVAGVTLTNVNVTVYQAYYDQLPMGKNGPILPSVDLNTMYEIKNTAMQALVQGQDFNIPFSNFRHFLSTMVVYNNQSGGAYPAAGSDINFLSLRSANATDLRKMDPYTWQTFTRRRVLTDTPVPLYLLDTRQKPVFTQQTGNMNLVINPSLVNTGASVLVGWEMLANVQNILTAGSLASS